MNENQVQQVEGGGGECDPGGGPGGGGGGYCTNHYANGYSTPSNPVPISQMKQGDLSSAPNCIAYVD